MTFERTPKILDFCSTICLVSDTEGTTPLLKPLGGKHVIVPYLSREKYHVWKCSNFLQRCLKACTFSVRNFSLDKYSTISNWTLKRLKQRGGLFEQVTSIRKWKNFTLEVKQLCGNIDRNLLQSEDLQLYLTKPLISHLSFSVC